MGYALKPLGAVQRLRQLAALHIATGPDPLAVDSPAIHLARGSTLSSFAVAKLDGDLPLGVHLGDEHTTRGPRVKEVVLFVPSQIVHPNLERGSCAHSARRTEVGQRRLLQGELQARIGCIG